MVIYYQNSDGQKIYFDRKPYKMLANTSLFDYEWGYTKQGYSFPKISSFERSMVEKQFELVIEGCTPEEYRRNLDLLLMVTEIDISKTSPGKLYIGNTYISCYIYKSKKSTRYMNTKKSVANISIVSETGKWILENKFQIRKASEATSDQRFLDYPYGYEYDYANSLSSHMVENTGYSDADFKMIIYGPCSNPSITIDGHVYRVYADILEREYLVINSADRTIQKVKNGGTLVNLFSSRERDSYIFQKIPIGKNSVVWSGEYGFDIIVYEERDEPRWI